MIKPTRPKPNRFKYVAMLAGALAVAAFPPIGLTAVATAQPRTWDIDLYDQCLEVYGPASNYTILEWVEVQHTCCDASDGVWDEWHGVCSAPPGNSQGSRQLPGNVHIPSDIATAPTMTKNPPRPIRVPSDIATVSTVSQGNELAS
jgi:hypothetical protein